MSKPIRDMKLAVTLLALGHEVQDFSIKGKTVYFSFDPDMISEDESNFYLRKLPLIPLEHLLSALQRFRLLLCRTQGEMLLVSSREAVISLMTAGFQTEGLQQLEKMLYFQFIMTPELKDFLLELVNGRGKWAAVDTFWREYQYFSDALRSR